MLKTEQPPLYDASTYFLKAQHFWAKIDQRSFFNPLNLDPTARPPGTILMSYPFGFNSDFRPFYFRSVFLPVLCLVMAIYIAVYSPAMQAHERWNLALLSIFLSALPMFYQFEMPIDNVLPTHYYWGLVDNFLAGIAALATGALIRSINNKSLKWIFAAVFLSSFCILIKPAGIFVIALVGFGSLMAVFYEIKPIRTMTIKVVSAIMLIYLFFLLTSFFSKYLSAENLSSGIAAIAIMKSELALNLSTLNIMLRGTFGYALLLGLPVMGLFAILYWKKSGRLSQTWSKSLLRRTIIAAFVNLAVGIWFWIEGSGGQTEIRYFSPFALMFIIWLFPLIMNTTAKMRRYTVFFFRLFCLLPAFNIILILATPNPSVAWLKATGVNTTIGNSKIVINQAQAFLNKIETHGDNVTLYSVDTGSLDAVFTSVGDYSRALAPFKPTYFIKRPLDWKNPSVYRLNDILESDYILFSPISDPEQRAQIISQKSIPTFEQEALLFRAWFTECTLKDGLVSISKSPYAILMQITEANKLESSLLKLRESYSWRGIFLEANSSLNPYLKRWWSQKEIASLNLRKDHPIEFMDISFGDVFKLHALSLKQINHEISLNVWWERLRDTPGSEWTFFIHSIDEKGNILENNEIRIPLKKSTSKNDNIRLSSIVLSKTKDKNLNALAVGFFTGDYILKADSGVRDWENHRVIIPLRDRN